MLVLKDFFPKKNIIIQIPKLFQFCGKAGIVKAFIFFTRCVVFYVVNTEKDTNDILNDFLFFSYSQKQFYTTNW